MQTRFGHGSVPQDLCYGQTAVVAFGAVLVGSLISLAIPAVGRPAALAGTTKVSASLVALEALRNVAFAPVQDGASTSFVARSRGVTIVVARDQLILQQGDDPSTRLTMRFIGSQVDTALVGEQLLPTRLNYFLGNDPSRWRTNVPTCGAVRYRDLYPGIDLVLHSDSGELRYDFEVAPGADPSRIRLAFEGANDVAVTAEGDLRVGVGSTFVRHRRPRLYQLVEGTRRPVEGSLRLVDDDTVAFAVGIYARGHALVIDPTIEFGSYYGGSGEDTIDGVAIDSTGNIHVAGTTSSINLPPPAGSPSQPARAKDVYAAVYDDSGSRLLCLTVLGGQRNDSAASYGGIGGAIAVDATGAVYVSGSTESDDFPTTPGSLAPIRPAGAAGFIAKMSSLCGQLVYSTYLPGADPYAVIADDQGSAYVTGWAAGSFPEVTPVAEAKGAAAVGFLAKLTPDGTAMAFSTRFGGASFDAGLTVAQNDAGRVYVAGVANSGDFPTKNAVQPASAGQGCLVAGEGFLVAFDTTTATLAFSTYFGGTLDDLISAVTLDRSGAVVITGWTTSPDFPLENAVQPQAGTGAHDAFLAKLTADGSQLLFSTYLGGSGQCYFPGSGCCMGFEGSNAVAVARDGMAWVAGFTGSSDFPLANPLQTEFRGARDAFVTAVSPAGSQLVFSTYLGGSGADTARGIAVAPDGDVVVVGTTDSTDFPTPNGAFPSYAGGTSDGFVVRIAAQATALTVSASATPISGLAPLAVSFTATPSGGTGICTFDWDFGDSSPHSNVQNPTHTYAAGGSYTARVTVTDSAAATATATVTIEVQASCYLTCTASAPLAASVLATSGLAPVPFAASASVSPDCPSSASFAWTFGDGQTSTEEDPSHVYPAPGAYDWTMTASVAGRVCTQRGTVVVTQLGDVDTLWIIPAVAHNDGFLGSKWRTDLALVNASSQPAGLSLVFFGADGAIVRTASLAGGASREWHDLLVSLFGLADDAVARGTVQLAADAPVALAARTYNLSPSGTYGQTFPALALGEGVTSGQGGLIAGLKKTAAFRTNLGVVNTSTQESTVRIALHDAAGAALGSPLTVIVPAGRWIQIDDVFAASGAPETELASASIEVLTPNTSAWAYAAVIDNATGDPTTVPVTVP